MAASILDAWLEALDIAIGIRERPQKIGEDVRGVVPGDVTTVLDIDAALGRGDHVSNRDLAKDAALDQPFQERGQHGAGSHRHPRR